MKTLSVAREVWTLEYRRHRMVARLRTNPSSVADIPRYYEDLGCLDVRLGYLRYQQALGVRLHQPAGEPGWVTRLAARSRSTWIDAGYLSQPKGGNSL